MPSTDTTPMLSRLLDPDSIALVGASADPEKLSGRPYRYLLDHGYNGDLHLVNPTHDELDGRPCYDSVTDIPGPVDVALVLVPAHLAADVVAECGEAEIPFAVVIASGFTETGEEGRRREATLLETAREAGVKLVGPNSEGFVNVPGRVAASFSSILKRETLIPGTVAFVTQSGGFGGALFQLTQDRGVGASTWISTGNEADLDALDFVEYLVEDPKTDVVVTFVESLSDGRRLLDVGRRAAETDTDIVAMRVGASERGRAAAASHTGSIASDNAVYDAVFDQAGVTEVWGIDELLDAVTALSRLRGDRLPSPDGGLAAISMSGGAAVLIADACDRLGVRMADLAPETRAAIAAEIPEYGSERNPLDVTAAAISDPAVFERCIRGVADDPDVNALLIQFGNSGRDVVEVFEDELLELGTTGRKPVVTVFTGSTPREETLDALREAGILVFEDPVRAVRTLAVLTERVRFHAERADAFESPLDGLADRDPFPDDSWDAAATALREAGVDVAEAVAVADADEAVAAADRLGYPVVVKYDPLAVPHKSELDGVRVGLDDPNAVRDAYRDLAATAQEPVLVQAMADGMEAIVGVVEDDDFGPVMLVGPGGVFVELFDEFAYRALPVTESMAREMVEDTPLGSLLGGFRDRPAGDLDALASAVAGLSDVYETYDLAELEVNPVVVTPDGALAVDLLVE